MGETSLIREIAAPYCKGKGVDLGCGGDKVTPDTWGFDMPSPYTHVGDDIIELKGDARKLPFNDGVLDYIFSSHLLEDFPNTKEVIIEWLRVIKLGGVLVLYLPDEQVYKKHCRETGQSYNGAHSIENMSLAYIKQILSGLPVEVIEEIELINTYSFFMVIWKKS